MQDTTVNGLLEPRSDKERVDKSGQTAQCMRVGGWITKPTVLADLSTLMVMFKMVNGSMIRHMDMVFIAILMEQDMKENGKRISNMVWVLKPGQMAPNSADNTFKERSMVRVPSPGLMDLPIQDNSLKTIFKEMENITGLTEENSTDHG